MVRCGEGLRSKEAYLGVVLVVMDSHGLLIEVGLQSVVGIGQLIQDDGGRHLEQNDVSLP